MRDTVYSVNVPDIPLTVRAMQLRHNSPWSAITRKRLLAWLGTEADVHEVSRSLPDHSLQRLRQIYRALSADPHSLTLTCDLLTWRDDSRGGGSPLTLKAAMLARLWMDAAAPDLPVRPRMLCRTSA